MAAIQDVQVEDWPWRKRRKDLFEGKPGVWCSKFWSKSATLNDAMFELSCLNGWSLGSHFCIFLANGCHPNDLSSTCQNWRLAQTYWRSVFVVSIFCCFYLNAIVSAIFVWLPPKMFKLKIDPRFLSKKRPLCRKAWVRCSKLCSKSLLTMLHWLGGGGGDNGCHPSCSSWRLTQI